jgi:hypothetical protein
LQYANCAAFVGGNIAQSLDAADVVLRRSVRKIQARNVHTSLHQFTQCGFTVA